MANIFYTNQFGIGEQMIGTNDQIRDGQDAEHKFMHFVQQTQEKNVFIYR